MKIEVLSNMVNTITCWAYDVNIRCLTFENDSVSEICVVLASEDRDGEIYTGISNSLGLVRFENIWNGTYIIRALSGRTIHGLRLFQGLINITQDEQNETLILNVTDLTIRVLTSDREPVFNATIRLYSQWGDLVGIQYTNISGYVCFKNLPHQTYALSIDWMNVRVGENYNLTSNNITMIARINRLTLLVLDALGRPMTETNVRFTSEQGLIGTYQTNASGYVSLNLPEDVYIIEVYQGMNQGLIRINLNRPLLVTLRCQISYLTLTYTSMVLAAWIGISIFWRWRRRGTILQVIKLKNMISKLDALYEKGEIKYSHYQKLRAEYEERLIDLRRREVE